ncbi:unnamed protein product, partial [Meganyctiphanes norvegica]
VRSALLIIALLVLCSLQSMQGIVYRRMPSEGLHNLSQTNACVDGKSMTNGGFCLSKDNVLVGDNDILDTELCGGLETLFGYATVVDFGAGLGMYGRCLLRIKENVIISDNPKEMRHLNKSYKAFMEYAGLYDKPKVIKSWKGYDGAGNIEEISSGFISYLDLSKEVDLKNRWDWAISIEVGEHIPAEREDAFIDNVAKHACKG